MRDCVNATSRRDARISRFKMLRNRDAATRNESVIFSAIRHTHVHKIYIYIKFNV